MSKSVSFVAALEPVNIILSSSLGPFMIVFCASYSSPRPTTSARRQYICSLVRKP
ncbi:hypothetical protein BJY01DRAFT_227565, partial [Aspergillus pseudoustus]